MLTACDPYPLEMVSERGDFRLSVEDLTTRDDPLVAHYWEPPYLVLAGTRMCPALLCDACPEGEACDDLTLQASGPVVADGDNCFVAEAPGEVVWTVDGACGTQGLPPDQVRMRVVAADEVEPRAYDWFDGLVARHAAREQPTVTTFGAPWPAMPPRDFKVVAGEELTFDVDLFERASGHPVARQAEAGEVTWTTTRGRPAITYPGHQARIVTFEGTESAATFSFAGHTWPLGHVTGVSADAVTSLELAGAMYVFEDPSAPLLGRTAVPLGARAIARDDAGDLVFGLPISWSAEAGNMAALPDFTQIDQIFLTDDCVAPEEREGPRRFVLRGRHGGLSANLEFTWRGNLEAGFYSVEPDVDWAPPATCLAPAGCGCRSADPGGASLLLLGLLGLRRRRRTSHVHKDMSQRSAGEAGRRAGSHVRKGMLFGTCLFALPLAACSEGPPALTVVEALPLGSLPLDSGPGEGGYSAAVGERVLWVFRDTEAGDYYGTKSSAAVLADGDARDGLHPFARYPVDGATPEDLLLLRSGEAAAARGGADCLDGDTCPHLSLWPGPVVHDPERARVLVFYRKVIQARGEDDRHVGSSIAVWRDDLAGLPVRPEVAEGSREPTLLFGADEPRLAAAALREDEFVYAFACDGRRNPCRLLRAPLERALERAAWQSLGRDGEWSGATRRAERLFDGAATMSVHWSEHAGAYAAVYADPDDAAIVVRTAPRLEGPWSDAGELYRPDAPRGPIRVRDALIHPELSREGGVVDYLTYSESLRAGDSGQLQLVEIRWE